jgi:hypothetical protein
MGNNILQNLWSKTLLKDTVRNRWKNQEFREGNKYNEEDKGPENFK